MITTLAPIQIKRVDVAEDVRILAEMTGLSLTDAIALAVRSQLTIERVKADERLIERQRKVEAGLAALRKLPVVGPDLTDGDLYGPDGMPK